MPASPVTLSSALHRRAGRPYCGDSSPRPPNLPLSAVFLAAGLSTRYRRPKQLEAVGPRGETLLDYGIHDALAAGVEHIIVVTRAELRDALRRHLDPSWGSRTITYVLQDSPAEGTWRPGGTGHAVLAAADAVDGSFAVANADDFYGAAAWADLGAFLRDGPGSHAALVGYRLADTLSPSGGVSRAVCRVHDEDAVTIAEWKDVRTTGTAIHGADLTGRVARLDGTAFVSMNLWGLRPGTLAALQGLSRSGAGEPPGAEFLLSSAMNALLHQGRVAIRVLPSRSRWFGLTHPADLPTVQAQLSRLTDGGAYALPLPPPHAP